MSIPINNYQSILKSLKEKISQARQRIASNVNIQLLYVYWEIGSAILEQQKTEGWGAKIIDRLASDLKMEFSDMNGLSVRNLKYMRAFAEAYPNFTIVQPAVAQLTSNNKENEFVQPMVAQIPWTHHIIILDKVKKAEERHFYVSKTIENGWSKNVLMLQIQNKLHERQGKAITNFSETLPAIQSDLAKETLRNPYVFDFLSFGEDVQERELEKNLILHLKNFMLELGRGFAYVGRQKNINVEGDDFFLDLLFYNYHLHCFVIFELKVGEFKPEYAGKLNFYINAINEQLITSEDKPTIGVLLCKTPNETVVKYALQGIGSPIGVADYELAKALPKDLRSEFPTIKELEEELEKETEKLQKPLDKKLNRIKELLGGLKTEEIKEAKSKEKARQIFRIVVVALKEDILTELSTIIELFYKCEILFGIGQKSFYDEQKAIEETGNYNGGFEMKVAVRLDGFKKAGTRSFFISEDITIRLEDYKYYCTLGYNHQPDTMWEKLYHQWPSEDDLQATVEKFGERLADRINEQLERITK